MGNMKRAGEMPPAAETRVAKQVRRTETMCEQLVTDNMYKGHSDAGVPDMRLDKTFRAGTADGSQRSDGLY